MFGINQGLRVETKTSTDYGTHHKHRRLCPHRGDNAITVFPMN